LNYNIQPTHFPKWQIQQKKKPKQSSSYHHLPNGDNGDGIPNPHPKHLVPDKYWAQRKRLFSKYDAGIQIEHGEMWYSVTPEAIALHIADKMIPMIRSCGVKDEQREMVVLDAFCGCGGNAIALARKNVRVIAVDNDLTRLRMAANNASVYGVPIENIVFVHADVVDVLRSFNKGLRCRDVKNDESKDVSSGYRIGGLELLPNTLDAIFLSPPWGGMGYENNDTFDPIDSIRIESRQNNCQSVLTNGGQLFQMSAKAVFSDSNEGVIAYFLPRNVDGIKLGQMAVASGIEHECFELEQNVVNGKVKTVTAYFGHSLKPT
jgi:trimethylguanosine synthase